MSAAEVRADYKVTVSGECHLTVEVMDGAVNELHKRGVPGWASITVNRPISGNRWAVTANWDPLAEPAPLPPPGDDAGVDYPVSY